MLYIFYLLKDDIILHCPVLFHYNVQEWIDKKKKKSIYKLLFSITICTAECEKLGKSVILFSIFSLKKRVLFYFDLNCLSHALILELDLMSCTLSSSLQVVVLVYNPLGFEEVIQILVSASILSLPCVIDFFYFLLLNIFFVNASYLTLIIYHIPK